MSIVEPANGEIAGMLDRIAELLESQDANPHRVRAYRTGAQSVRDASKPLAEVVRQGDTVGLQELPGIGEGLAGAITEFVNTGKLDYLNSLQAQTTPEAAISKVPAIGKKLAQRVVDTLHIKTLEELEQAAYDGRLAQVEGFGAKRVEAIKLSLAGQLGGAAQRRREIAAGDGAGAGKDDQPDVQMLLDVDAEYQRKAAAGELKTIAPRRLNPTNEAWLPVMRTRRDDWNFTALYSNTARAHELGTTHDWVVLYYQRGGRERQCTVVTATNGPLQGKRVVRGRESESRRFYEAKAQLEEEGANDVKT